MAQGDIVGLLGDAALLVGVDDEHLDLGAGRVDLDGARAHHGDGVLGLVQLNAEQLEVGTDALADHGGRLADARREDDSVRGAAELEQVGAEVLAHPVGVDVHGEVGHGVVVVADAVLDDADVALSADAEQAALLVEHLVDLCDRHVELCGEKVVDGRVDVSAARAHDESLERRESHGGVDALSVADGGHAGSVAEVAGDNGRVLDVLAEDPGGLVEHELVAGAVEAVAAHAMVLVERVGHAVGEGLGGHGGVEGRVEDGDLGHVLAKYLGGHVDAEQVARVVQRGELDVLLDGLEHLVVDARGAREGLSAVDDAVADGLDVVHVGAEEAADGQLERRAVRVQGQRDLLLLASRQVLVRDASVGRRGRRELHESREHGAPHAAGLDVEELVLERRGARVHHQQVRRAHGGRQRAAGGAERAAEAREGRGGEHGDRRKARLGFLTSWARGRLASDGYAGVWTQKSAQHPQAATGG